MFDNIRHPVSFRSETFPRILCVHVSKLLYGQHTMGPRREESVSEDQMNEIGGRIRVYLLT